MRSLLFLLITIVSVFGAKAQVGFTENIVIDSSLNVQQPRGAFPADLDGDGDMDILSSSYNGDRLVWFENVNGIGTDYIKHLISSTIANPWGVHAADLDGDGDLDVLAASLSGNHIIWYENTDGNANFVEKQIIPATEVEFIKTVDIDGDSDLDIVWSSRLDGTLKYTLNTDGLGTFVSSFNIENNVSSIPNFHLADIDGDGAVDVVSSWSIQGGSQGVSWYKNPNGGPFGNRLVISNDVSNVTSVYAGDLDGDGDIDVAAALAGDEKIVWYENLDGLGSFGTEQVLANNAAGAFQVRMFDMDDDGDLDVISAANGTGKITWFKNLDGAGNFSSEILIDSFLGTMRSLEIADINGDNNPDIVTVTDGDNNIKWYNNTDGQGNFSAYTITKYISGGKVVSAADLDGDGDLDLLSASHWDDKIAWYENKDTQGDFHDSQKIISETVNGASSVVAADLDGDGDMDVIATSSLDDDVMWYKNTDGNASFSEPIVIENNLYSVNKAYVSDIDNDGDIDIICIARGKIVWYENVDGQGNFAPLQQIESINNFYIESIDLGDLNGDGAIDIAAASSYGLLYFINLDGQGTFGPRQIIEDYNWEAVSTKITDIDGDGDNDIVYTGTNSTTDYVGWAENTDGLGTFGAIRLITTIISNPKDLSVFDVDNDGDVDVVSSSYQGTGTGIIAWYENTDGLGDFSNTQQIITTTPGGFEFDLIKAHINQDNTIDIVSINNANDEIIWYGNIQTTLVNQITGTVRLDLLADGCTPDDELLSGVMIIAEGSTTTQATFSQENGTFRLVTTEDSAVNTQITSQLPNYYQPNPAVFQSDFTGFGNVDLANFCIEPTATINDLNISAYPMFNAPRPGFNTSYRLVYKNVGTTQLSGSVIFGFDGSKLNFLNATEPISSQTANALTFNFEDLNPFEVKTIDIKFNVFPPPTTNIDDVLVTTVTINPIPGDLTEADNVLSFEEIVVGSYDPNDMMVLQGEEIFIDEATNYLNYLIRFQNTGTASAINVNVTTVLDEKLDWTTMQLESLSHSAIVEITDGSNVNFVFNDINLPDSTSDEEGSHGFIAFKIKPKTNVEIGDVISGLANIYFDFNPAIITNTVHTEIMEPLSVDEFNVDLITLYPNPVKNVVNIASKALIDKIAITDINGRLLRTAKVSNTTNSTIFKNQTYRNRFKRLCFLFRLENDTNLTGRQDL
jgi:hypothetical protein